jgi:hypothetical protein
MTENERVLDTLAIVRRWLEVGYGPQPNRSGTTWRVGSTNIELAYVMGEGSLTLWSDGHKDTADKLVTRGRDETDVAYWIGTLEALRP